jgi:hypothetical protein
MNADKTDSIEMPLGLGLAGLVETRTPLVIDGVQIVLSPPEPNAIVKLYRPGAILNSFLVTESGFPLLS